MLESGKRSIEWTVADHEAEIERLREDAWKWRNLAGEAAIETERLRSENLALVDAMRDARALLHRPRPASLSAASMLGDALTARALTMLPEEGEDDA